MKIDIIDYNGNMYVISMFKSRTRRLFLFQLYHKSNLKKTLQCATELLTKELNHENPLVEPFRGGRRYMCFLLPMLKTFI